MTRHDLTDLLALAAFVVGAILFVLAAIDAVAGGPTILQRLLEAL